ncbi:acetyltransferase (GNAT) family protein [Micromonospora sp. Llam0]|uniref:GNAT family N-acetyltransferase n=1 Tax=Micromonospora sp. Llam0 TaxID=2485143 RepID=UPI000F49ACC1|nr:GNAT family N-acetyltransferase [Micromonospora sp. Llam0]ROO62461.1 acetyltransferase (GNAT) family protein [Micromonospora sp. Llam0]
MTTTPTRTVIRVADRHDIPALTATLVEAFVDTPDAVWLIPDPGERRRVYQRLCPAILTHAMTSGTVYTSGDHAGAAVWLPHTAAGNPDPHHTALIDRIAGQHAPRFARLAAVLHHHTPHRPHTYLAYLGVAPDRQRHGLGTALLTHRHATCDTAGTPVHLVATTTDARRLYQQHGYYDTTPTPVHLPDGGPPLWPMWRQPHTRSRGTAPGRGRP